MDYFYSAFCHKHPSLKKILRILLNMYVCIPQKKSQTDVEQDKHIMTQFSFFLCFVLYQLFLRFVSSEVHCLYFYPCSLCKSPLLNSQISHFTQNFSGYLDVWGSVGMEVAFIQSFSLSFSGPAVISQPRGWKKCFLPLSFSLSLSLCLWQQ